ncbi:amino acid ABC transporter permease [Gardnerella sp. Marseille-Q9179]|uniref:amino acid ABC transporter permease n=1 Tax=Gardnerella sp. Marseille-Q9179 TaxID=3383028 RepID=UPI003AF722DA
MTALTGNTAETRTNKTTSAEDYNVNTSSKANVENANISKVERNRRLIRKKQNLRSVGISILSTVVLVGVVVITLAMSPGWPRVRETFFSGKYFMISLPSVLQGLMLNLQVLVFAVIGVAILGTLIAVIRTSTSPLLFPLRVIAQFYTTIMRGIPMLVVLYLIGFGIPGLQLFGRIPPSILGTIAIVMSYSAYVGEVLRAGFEDVHPSMRASARSLGLTSGQTVRLVVIPLGLRKVAPALMNDFISMQKDAGLISVLGAVDAVRAAQISVATSYNFTPYVVASVVFIALSIPFIVLNDWYTARLRKRELNGGTV